MQDFVQRNAHSEPDMKTNSFCLLYFNQLIQDMNLVMSNPTVTDHDIDQLLQRMKVDKDTDYYRYAQDRVNKDKLDKLSKRVFSSTVKSGQEGRNVKLKRNGTITMSTFPCFMNISNIGCKRNNCRFSHDLSLITADVKKKAKESFKKYNDKNPNGPRCVLEETKA